MKIKDGTKDFLVAALFVLLIAFTFFWFKVILPSTAQAPATTQASTIPADEVGWCTIASKPIWNEKAQLWEVTCYLSRTPAAETPVDQAYVKRMELPVVLAICSPDNNVCLKMKFLDKGDKAYLLYPRTQGTSVYFVGNIKTAGEYRSDVNPPSS